MRRALPFAALLAVAAPDLAGARPSTWLAAANATASLTTSYTCTRVDGAGTVDANASAVPKSSELSLLHSDLSSISSATTITWYIALDSGGDDAITDEATETIVDADSDGNGTVSTQIGAFYAESSLSTVGALWVCAKTDAGTATATHRLFGRTIER